jgi:type II secretory ATPase GspE/PulE/Tfp pilus assembly ATPase PilB-like protein
VVDGVAYDGQSLNKSDAASAVSYFKAALGLDVNDRRKPQLGSGKAVLNGKKHELRVVTSGSTAGEQLIVDIDVKTRHDIALSELGFFPEQLDAIKKSIDESAGVVLLATPEGQGLTTLEYSILRAHDAFVQHIQTIERHADVELEGITQNELAPNASNTEELKLVRWVCSQQPDIVMITRIVEPKSSVELLRFGEGDKRAYVGLRASSAFHALDMWRKLVGDDKLAMKNLRMVVAGRVMRKLCSACKVEYAPEPETLRKLNMSPDKVGRLFQARTSPLRDPKGNPIPCDFCHDLRFKGRVGVFEVFSIDDEVRQVVESGASLDRLKMAFKKQKRRYMQEYAVARAVAGDTSLQEVARILRMGEPSGSSSKRTA